MNRVADISSPKTINLSTNFMYLFKGNSNLELDLGDDSPDSPAYWFNELSENETILKIINTDAFQRLRHISFLGAIGLTHRAKKEKKRDSSRTIHSINVAALANYVSVHRNYSSDLKKHLVVAALLHDIGHFPLSHSAEPFIHSQVGFGHHEMGEMIINGEMKIGNDLNKLLKNHFDIEFILKLLNKEIDNSYGGDLFSSPINIDTIDGIYRANNFLTKEKNDIFSVAKAAFITDDDNLDYETLDTFWLKKDFVYRNLINTERGIISDEICNRYFFYKVQNFDNSLVASTEKSWDQKFDLIRILLDMKGQRIIQLPPWFNETTTLNYTSRQYLIDKTKEKIEERYICTKERKIISVETEKNYKNGDLFTQPIGI